MRDQDTTRSRFPKSSRRSEEQHVALAWLQCFHSAAITAWSWRDAVDTRAFNANWTHSHYQGPPRALARLAGRCGRHCSSLRFLLNAMATHKRSVKRKGTGTGAGKQSRSPVWGSAPHPVTFGSFFTGLTRFTITQAECACAPRTAELVAQASCL